MSDYQRWLRRFLIGKTECSAPESMDKAVHSIRRFIDENKVTWETGVTSTGRLVLRKGYPTPDGSLKSEPWLTKHDVEMPITEAPDMHKEGMEGNL